MRQNLVEKTAQAHVVGLLPGQVVRSGDFLTVPAEPMMANHRTTRVLPRLSANGSRRPVDQGPAAPMLDHYVQKGSTSNPAKHDHINSRPAIATVGGPRTDLAPLGVATQEPAPAGGPEIPVRAMLPART